MLRLRAIFITSFCLCAYDGFGSAIPSTKIFVSVSTAMDIAAACEVKDPVLEVGLAKTKVEDCGERLSIGRVVTTFPIFARKSSLEVRMDNKERK